MLWNTGEDTGTNATRALAVVRAWACCSKIAIEVIVVAADAGALAANVSDTVDVSTTKILRFTIPALRSARHGLGTPGSQAACWPNDPFRASEIFLRAAVQT